MTSFSAKAINLYLRFAGIKKTFLNEENARAAIAEDRAKGPAKPGGWIKKHCDIQEFAIDGFTNVTITPRENPSDRHVVYFHGGGYALDIVDFHWQFIGKLIKQTGATVTVPIYPMAPEHDWTAAYPVMLKLYEQLLQQVDPGNMVFMGDSAGGGWSLGLAQMLRDQDKPLPSKLVLLSPWLDATATHPMQPEIDPHDRIVAIEGLRIMGRWWAGKSSAPADPPISPINASIESLPPMIAFSGTHDILYPDTLALKDKADAAGIPLESHIYPKMQHVWMLLPIKEARQAMDQIVRFLKS